jgi:cobalt/nickel transport system permease protein
MHLSDGVLEWPVLLSSAALSGTAVFWGLRRLPIERLPHAAVLAAVFFVGGTIHIPLGVGSVHLVLSGLIGLLLGAAVFPVLLVGLLLQATLLSFGGLTVLGANLLVLGLPAAMVGVLLRPYLARTLAESDVCGVRADPTQALTRSALSRRAMWLGGVAGGLSLLGSMLLAALLLWVSGGERWVPLITLISAAHMPALVVDSLITALTISMLMRFAPDVVRTLLVTARRG